MFFYLSKALWTFADPANLLLISMIIGALLLWTGWRRAGRVLLSWVLAFLLLISVVPLGGYAMAFLEQRFPAAEDPTNVDGIVLLGGAIDAANYYLHPGSGYTSTIGRVIEAARLAKRHPSASIIVAGGPEPEPGHSEADATRQVLLDLGVAPERIELEVHSRNTFENAVFVKQIAKPKPGEHWLLVTSAFHMPRAMGCFRAADFPVTAYPVDYKYGAVTTPRFNVFDGLSELKYAIHEYTGLIAYRLSGKTRAFVPGP
jgi:uncharacterized SAM-binding protein YcdF (DUF218 family)